MAVIKIEAKKDTRCTQTICLIQGDRRTQILRFGVNRYDGGVDLSDLVWAIKTTNAKGVDDVFEPAAVEISESKITIDWLVDGTVTDASGMAKYELNGLDATVEGKAVVWKGGTGTMSLRANIGENFGEIDMTNIDRLVLYVEGRLQDIIDLTDSLQNGADSANAAAGNANTAASAANSAASAASTAAGNANAATAAANAAAETANTAAANIKGDVDRLSEEISKLSTYVTPEMFGAVGDGVADDTGAVQSAVDSGKVVMLSSYYAITQPIIISKSRTAIYGYGARDGESGAIGLKQLNLHNDVLQVKRTYRQDVKNVYVKGLHLGWDGLPAENTAALRLWQAGDKYDGWGIHHSAFEDISTSDCYHGIHVDDNEPIWGVRFRMQVSRCQKRVVYYKNGFDCEFDIFHIGESLNSDLERGYALTINGGATVSADIEDWDTTVINCESVFNPVEFTQIHLERCCLKNNYGAFIKFSDTLAIVNSVLCYDCSIDVTDHCSLIIAYGSNSSNMALTAKNIHVNTLNAISGQFHIVNPSGTKNSIIDIVGVKGVGSIFYPYVNDGVKATCFYNHSNGYVL